MSVCVFKDLELSPGSWKELEDHANVFRKKNLEILKSFSTFDCSKYQKKFILHFNRTPVEIIGASRVEKVSFEINHEGKPTGQYEEIDCGAFFTSIGQVGMPMEGVPFLHQKGIVPNRQGRVLGGEGAIKGWYVSGWIGHGASGLIGTNKLLAQETVHSLMEDLQGLSVCEKPDTEEPINLLKERGVTPVTFIDWKKIDAYEIMMGLSLGKPREKVTRISKMISLARH